MTKIQNKKQKNKLWKNQENTFFDFSKANLPIPLTLK